MLSNLLFSYFSYEIKYHVSYIKQNSLVLATICKRSHVDKMNGAPVGPFRVCIDKKTLYIKIRRLEHPQRKRQTCLYSKAIPNMGWRIRQRSVQEVKIILLPVRMQLYIEMSHLPVRKKLYLVKNDQELTVSSRYRVSGPDKRSYMIIRYLI